MKDILSDYNYFQFYQVHPFPHELDYFLVDSNGNLDLENLKHFLTMCDENSFKIMKISNYMGEEFYKKIEELRDIKNIIE